MKKLLLTSVASMSVTLAMAGGAVAQPVKPVTPGSIVVHLNGYLQFEFANYGSTYNTVSTPIGTFKLNPVTTDGDVRMYPGFDAQTLTGIEYGAQIELRTTTSDAGRGADKVTGTGSTAGCSCLYVKRAYGYIGTPSTGFVRLGQTDGTFDLMQVGVIEAFGDGAQFNTDGGVASLLPVDATPGNFIYADTSNLYATDKLVYLSPKFSGFGFGFAYEPNSNGIKEGYGNNNFASSTSAALTSSPIASDIGTRRKNTVDMSIEYTTEMNGVSYEIAINYLHGAPISYTGVPTALGTPTHFGYDNLSVYQAGAQVTWAGLTVGANIKGGQVEDGYSFKPKGARDALTYIIGADYVLNSLVFGASYWNGQSAGQFVPGNTAHIARTLSEYGIAVGANYVVGPDMTLFLQYLYGHRHQPGALVPSPAGSSEPELSEANTQVQAIGIGATLKW
jgi:predicted porin